MINDLRTVVPTNKYADATTIYRIYNNVNDTPPKINKPNSSMV